MIVVHAGGNFQQVRRAGFTVPSICLRNDSTTRNDRSTVSGNAFHSVIIRPFTHLNS